MNELSKETFTSTYHVSPQFLVSFLIFILTLAIHLGTLNHEFVSYDDDRIILPRVNTFNDLSLKNIMNIIVDDYPREEPLIVRDLSYLVNGSIFGAHNPQGYLLGNILLHMITSYLVFSLSLLLFPEKYWLAITTAVLFAIHPVHVESVAWISSRKDTLYCCFFLAGLLTYSQFVKTNKPWLVSVSLWFYVLAIFSKSSAIAFVPIVLFYRCLFAPNKKWRWQETTYFVLLVMTSILFMQWYSRILNDFGIFEQQNAPSLTKEDPGLWLLLNIEVITFYLSKLIYPDTLSIIYDFPAPHIIFKHLPYFALSLTTFTVLLFTLLKFIRMEDKRPLFLMAWFFIVLSPYLNWAGINIFVADRYLYLAAFAPLCGFSYILMSSIAMAKERHRAFGSLTVALTCLIFFAMITKGISVAQVWTNTKTLWTHVMEAAPFHVEPYIGLLKQDLDTYSQRGRSQEGKDALTHAKEIANQGFRKLCRNDNCPPQAFGILYYIAKIYYLEGNLALAKRFLQQALLLKPDDIHLSYLHTYIALKEGDYLAAQEDIEFITTHANPHEHVSILVDINGNIAPHIEKQLKAQ